MSKTRRSNSEDLVSIAHTYHNGKIIRGIIQEIGSIENPPIDPNDSGVYIPPIELTPALATLSDSGAPLEWDQHYPTFQQQNTYESRQKDIDDALSAFRF